MIGGTECVGRVVLVEVSVGCTAHRGRCGQTYTSRKGPMLVWAAANQSEPGSKQQNARTGCSEQVVEVVQALAKLPDTVTNREYNVK